MDGRDALKRVVISKAGENIDEDGHILLEHEPIGVLERVDHPRPAPEHILQAFFSHRLDESVAHPCVSGQAPKCLRLLEKVRFVATSKGLNTRIYDVHFAGWSQ